MKEYLDSTTGCTILAEQTHTIMKLFTIQDYVIEENKIILFIEKNGKEAEITFTLEKFELWLETSDRLLTEIYIFGQEWPDGDTRMVRMDIEEYWQQPCNYIKEDLYEYVILRLIAPHELFNGTEKAILSLTK